MVVSAEEQKFSVGPWPLDLAFGRPTSGPCPPTSCSACWKRCRSCGCWFCGGLGGEGCPPKAQKGQKSMFSPEQKLFDGMILGPLISWVLTTWDTCYMFLSVLTLFLGVGPVCTVCAIKILFDARLGRVIRHLVLKWNHVLWLRVDMGRPPHQVLL